mmetsp:Transcript_3756/g.5813  ORF Transcript_3756/g.5813 Transcript_3756/m.5813 type:complete len:85 (-) Transcript_3756:650-904(-)
MYAPHSQYDPKNFIVYLAGVLNLAQKRVNKADGFFKEPDIVLKEDDVAERFRIRYEASLPLLRPHRVLEQGDTLGMLHGLTAHI